MIKSFQSCEICGADVWTEIYDGTVRNGQFERISKGKVAECGSCGVHRLAEASCMPSVGYDRGDYRELLGQSHALDEHQAVHDQLAKYTTALVSPKRLRNLTIADVGCGGGTLLDHLSGLTKNLIAIDPDTRWSSSLEERGYEYFSSTLEAGSHWNGKVDIAFAIQVVEHVPNPNKFITEIGNLLKPDGIAVISTPNRNDILMHLLPNDFPKFFYRTQHRWIFDGDSLLFLLRTAGFKERSVRYVHRYGFANATSWLRELRPRGDIKLGVLDESIDNLWRTWLEMRGYSDNLYAVASNWRPE